MKQILWAGLDSVSSARSRRKWASSSSARASDGLRMGARHCSESHSVLWQVVVVSYSACMKGRGGLRACHFKEGM